MKPLSRRTLLRGAGVALGLPLLDAMVPARAEAQAMSAPRRIIFEFKPNGDEVARRFTTRGTTNFVLGEFLAPLEPYRNELLFLENVDKRFGRLPQGRRADAHQQGGSSLAPWPSGSGSFPIGGTNEFIGYVEGPSADYELGGRVLADNPSMPYRHLVFRVGQRENHIWNLHSHAGPVGMQNPVAPETDPWAAYTRLFGTLDDGAAREAVVRRLAKKHSALDLVMGELTSLRGRLGAGDRTKLERHTESLRDIERALVEPDVGNLACRAFGAGMRVDPYADQNHQVVGQLFQKIIAVAFACDMTRVVNFNWSGNTSNRVYANLGLSEGHHDISHNGDAGAFTNVRRIHRHLWTLSTGLYEELKNTPEGSGSVWDNTLVVHWNELAQGDTHDTSQNLVVLAGGMGGYFRRGRYLDFQRNTTRGFSDMLVSCFHYMGYDTVTRFGDALLSSNAPLGDLV